jgi:hypothetical protein
MSYITDSRQANHGVAISSIVDKSMEDYTLWAQVAGYFDGDGSVHLRTDSPVVLRFALVWVDNSFNQLSQLRRFLISHAITLGNVLRQGVGVFRLQIASPRFALAASTQMIPFCSKKKEELRILRDYYEDGITGTEAVSGINEMVRLGVRLGSIRVVPVLPRYSEGKRIVARARGHRAAEVRWERKHDTSGGRHVSNVTRGGRPPPQASS